MAEQYLVTDEVKEKLNLETIRVKTTIEEENYLNCRKVLLECSGTSASQPIAPEDSMNQGPLAIPQAVSPPDQTTVQQQFKEQTSTSDTKNPKKLGKKGISETTAEHGTSAAQPRLPEDSVCPLDPTTVQQQFKEGETNIGNKSPKKLGKRGISESSAEHDMDTHETAKVQTLEEQLHRVTPEAFYEPGSVLELEVKEEEKVLATSEDEQHLRDFGETSSSKITAADDWLEQSPLAIPKAVGQLHPTPLNQHIGEGSVSVGSKNEEKLGKRRFSDSSAGHGTDTSGIAKMLRSEEQLPSVSSETFYEPHFSMHKSKSNEEKKALATPGNSTSGGFGGEGDGTPSSTQQSVLDQGTSIIEMATAAGHEEVPVSFCIIFKNLKGTLAYLESFFLSF
ncbi:uncharacterized protein LOC141880983 isoform X1 [Acropora palmata]|uniref:uncharacterized protein LOC141880983 isoform X1 n=1 Tax=Acropora palmata TaxID=6131 RepID=UPI003DA07392